MGVPKFYRWISERYPQINQLIGDGTLLPEFDSLYLDMNGIIHGCTHPADADLDKAITVREMMLGIFRYIERLVTEIVKPKKVLFMAIDGVAPRAKLNQQRSRRFRAAEERMENLAKMKAKDDLFNEDDMFDSNCITPGTEFMETVGAHIRWFIRKKVKDDPIWRDLTIVFSGHDVPGEGEHKIMQYIRENRLKPGYEPNQRHCMVGQDADLIMLALATHEPHFILLREVIDFGGFKGPQRRGNVRQTVMRQSKDAQFQLLHISVLREYIELDLSSYNPKKELEDGEDYDTGANLRPVNSAAEAPVARRKLDRERLVDDFILLTFLVGNDFLPHLPTLDISEHAFDVIFDAYKRSMEAHGLQYLVENGELRNVAQLETLFSIIGEQEASILTNRAAEVASFAKRKSKRGRMQSAQDTELTFEEKEALEAEAQKRYEEAVRDAGDTPFVMQEEEEEPDEEEEEEEDEGGDGGGFFGKMGRPGKGRSKKAQGDAAGAAAGEDDEVGGLAEGFGDLQFVEYKELEPAKDFRGRYYFEKFKLLPGQVRQSAFMDKLRDSYLEGLMWCLAYYTRGCVSWTWYFPYHYGPMLIDMRQLPDSLERIAFTLGQPFRPFQQLLGCLPPASRRLLPKKYQWLMSDHLSPVKEFYPLEFAIDMDGKKNPWEAVVLLPFIDEKRVLEAEKLYCGEEFLSFDEKRRNTFGNVLTVKFNPSVTTTYFSCNAEIGLEDIRHCQSEVEESFPSLSPSLPFAPTLIPGTITSFPGYPSLTTLPVASSFIDFMKVNVFGSPSKYQSVVLNIDSQASALPTEPEEEGAPSGMGCPAALAVVENKLINLIGRSVFVNYPLLHEAKVTAISTEVAEYRAVSTLPLTSTSIEQHIAALQQGINDKQKEISRRFFMRDTQDEGGKAGHVDRTVKLLKGGTVLKIPHHDDDKAVWLQESEDERGRYLQGKGIPGTGGIDIGSDIQVRLRVNALQGLRRDAGSGATKKVFGTAEADVPLQMVLLHSTLEDVRFKEMPELPVDKLLPHGCEAVVMSGKYAGTMCKVVGPHGPASEGKRKGTAANAGRVVDVEFMDFAQEPPFAYNIAQSIRDHYYSSRDICEALHISPSLLGRIVGSISVSYKDPSGGSDRVDIGLDLRRNGQYQLLGYARLRQKTAVGGATRGKENVAAAAADNIWKNCNAVEILGAVANRPAPTGGPGAGAASGKSSTGEESGTYWEYSALTVALLADYKLQFPDLFHNLESLPFEKCYQPTDLFRAPRINGSAPSDSGNNGTLQTISAYEQMKALLEWMQQQPCRKLPRTPFTTDALPREAIRSIERAADVRTSINAASVASNTVQRKILRSVPCDMLFRGETVQPTDAPLEYNHGMRPRLGDRVVNLSAVGVPFGLKGSVVVTHSHTGYVEVLFDEEFVGGKSLSGLCSQFRGRLVPWSTVLRLPQRAVGATTSSSSAAHASAQANASAATSGRKSGPAAPHPAAATNDAISSKDQGKGKKATNTPAPAAAPAPAAPAATKGKQQAISILKRKIGAGASAPAGGDAAVMPPRPPAEYATPPPPPPTAVAVAPVQSPPPVPPQASGVFGVSAGRSALAAAASGFTIPVSEEEWASVSAMDGDDITGGGVGDDEDFGAVGDDGAVGAVDVTALEGAGAQRTVKVQAGHVADLTTRADPIVHPPLPLAASQRPTPAHGQHGQGRKGDQKQHQHMGKAPAVGPKKAQAKAPAASAAKGAMLMQSLQKSAPSAAVPAATSAAASAAASGIVVMDAVPATVATDTGAAAAPAKAKEPKDKAAPASGKKNALAAAKEKMAQKKQQQAGAAGASSSAAVAAPAAPAAPAAAPAPTPEEKPPASSAVEPSASAAPAAAPVVAAAPAADAKPAAPVPTKRMVPLSVLFGKKK